MLEQLLGLVLIGLGIRTPQVPPAVLGDETEAVLEVEKSSDDLDEDRKENKERNENKDRKENNERKENKEAIKQIRKTTQEEYKAKKELLNEQIKEKREQAKERYTKAREDFQNRLDTIKDERKKEIVENLDNRFSTVNTNRTTAMSNHVAKMEEVITKISETLSERSAQGVNVSQVQTALSAAQVSVSAAKTAVTTQAGKEYIIGVTTEDKLKDSVERVRTLLETDLKATQEKVKKAREDLASVIQSIARIRKSASSAVESTQ